MAAQAGLFLAWSETPEDTFCHVVAHTCIANPRNLNQLGKHQDWLCILCFLRVLSIKRGQMNRRKACPTCTKTISNMAGQQDNPFGTPRPIPWIRPDFDWPRQFWLHDNRVNRQTFFPIPGYAHRRKWELVLHWSRLMMVIIANHRSIARAMLEAT